MRQAMFAVIAATALLAAVPARPAGSPEAGQRKATVCAACHGMDGNSVAPNFPKLAGLDPEYIVRQLHAFKDGTRSDPSMTAMATPLSPRDMEDVAAFYSRQERSPGVAEEDLVARGQLIYRGGITATSVPACSACHGPRGTGNPAANFPAVGGQHAQYLVAQLGKFRSGERSSDPNRMMRNVAARMSDEEIRAVASYMAGLH